MDETMLFQRCQAGKNLIKHDPRFKMAEGREFRSEKNPRSTHGLSNTLASEGRSG